MYHWPKSLTERERETTWKTKTVGLREILKYVDVKEIVSSCRNGPFDFEHGAGACCCEVDNGHGNKFCEFLIAQLLAYRRSAASVIKCGTLLVLPPYLSGAVNVIVNIFEKETISY